MINLGRRVIGECLEVINFRIYKVVEERSNLIYCRFMVMKFFCERIEDLE